MASGTVWNFEHEKNKLICTQILICCESEIRRKTEDDGEDELVKAYIGSSIPVAYSRVRLGGGRLCGKKKHVPAVSQTEEDEDKRKENEGWYIYIFLKSFSTFH